ANGSRDNLAIFGELAIPVLEDLEVQFAVRYEDYSDFGTTTDPKISFIWSPTDDLSLRGSYGTAFRAPSLHQLGLGRTDESPNLVDTLRCEAIGNQDRACEPQEYTAVFEGNPNLGPEESESYNLGVIYNITDDLNFTLDYYNYDITDIIDSDTQFVMDNYGLDGSIVERRPTNITNDPGEVIQINDSFQNIGDLQTSGIDLDVRYNLDTSAGNFKFGYILNYVLNFEDYKNTEEGGFEQPQMRWTTSVDWLLNDFGARAAINYIDSFEQKASLKLNKKVDAMVTLDASMNYFTLITHSSLLPIKKQQTV
ncbi:MAG: TonB-dependent receptor, partial [Alteromonadales bacterium]|nr:TonB-dependent receptor [Alteromonadales bacterium]